MNLILELLRIQKHCIKDGCSIKPIAMKMCRGHYRAWVSETYPSLAEQANKPGGNRVQRIKMKQRGI